MFGWHDGNYIEVEEIENGFVLKYLGTRDKSEMIAELKLRDECGAPRKLVNTKCIKKRFFPSMPDVTKFLETLYGKKL
jgi:hypothetical protein